MPRYTGTSATKGSPSPKRGAEIARDYWSQIAEAFVAPLQPQGLIASFSSNPNIKGAYAEEWVRSVARGMLPKLRVSTGAIGRPTDARDGKLSTPQIDVLIWDPSWLPPIFECGNFVVIHTQAARGVIEVKRSLRVSARDRFHEDLKRRRTCLMNEYRANCLGVVIAGSFRSDRTLLDSAANDKWAYPDMPPIVRLLSSDFRLPDEEGLFTLTRFLSRVARSPDPITFDAA